MKNRERFLSVLNGRLPDDRLPVIEFSMWWTDTLKRWHGEGLDPKLEGDALFKHLNLDVFREYWIRYTTPDCPKPAYHGAPLIANAEDYEKFRKYLYPEHAIDPLLEDMRQAEPMHQAGDMVLWYILEGGFWFPRTLLGIEGHLLSFYDEPELYHRIVDDVVDFQLRQLDKIYEICTPEYMTVAEDMSYNLGPMLSEEMFDEFVAPYYRRIVPYIRERGTKVFVDSDGDVTMMIPWLQKLGVEGITPLERQAGVDLAELSRRYPDFLFFGGFDKMVMTRGEEAMRAEFERLLPVLKRGHYIPSVDHQTPPGVSLEDYKTYVRLLHEYCERAVREGREEMR